MTNRRLGIVALALGMGVPGAAFAQEMSSAAGSPAWLKDRTYAEGAGIRTSDFEFHPGVSGEAGYDSNYYLRSSSVGYANYLPSGPVQALAFRITPSLSLATLGPQRKEGDLYSSPPTIRFRANMSATYRQPIAIGASSEESKTMTGQGNVSGGIDARLEILPERPWGAVLNAGYMRTVQPNVSGDVNLAFNHDDVVAGAQLVYTTPGAMLDWHLGYQLRATLFEQSAANGLSNLTNEFSTRGRWKFSPRTALVYDATMQFVSYTDANTAAGVWGLYSSTPLRARFGLTGLITPRFGLMALAGYGTSFANTTNNPKLNQYDSVIGQAELRWFLSGNPGQDASSALSLTLSSIAVGYNRDFMNSYLGNFIGVDRGYVKFAYFFAGRALISLDGGVSMIEYPTIYWGPTTTDAKGDPLKRSSAFTDARADATLFGEYRFSDSFAIDATLRYSQNFSSTYVTAQAPGTAGIQPGLGNYFDMSWNRFEGFLGVRWFL